MVFRRRRGDDDEAEQVYDDDTPDESSEPESAEPEGSAPRDVRTTGPYDDAEAPEDGLARIDLGALHVQIPDGIEVRVDVQEQTVVAATLVDGHSAMQVHAFAAPRSGGIWAEVRDEIAQSLRESGGSAEEVDGPFGRELAARVPAAPAGAVAPG